jgi:hypothetical protein
VRTKAYECLARVAELYYDKLQSYVEAIFQVPCTGVVQSTPTHHHPSIGLFSHPPPSFVRQLTTSAIRTDDPAVGMQAIEFWTTVCDCEASIKEDMEEGVVHDPPQVYLKLVEQAAPTLVPILLETLTKQQEDADGEDWTISMTGATCLEAMSVTIADAIVPHVMPFVQANITSPNWRMKEAAIMAFCSVLDGPSPKDMRPIVNQAMPVLIGCLQDAHQMVRESAAYTIAKICECHKDSITQEMLRPMVEGLVTALQDASTRTCSQVCYALHNFAAACAEEADNDTNVLSPFIPVLLEKLLATSTRQDCDEDNVRAAAYEAVNMMVSNSARDVRHVVNELLKEALNRLEVTFQPNFPQADRMALQSLLCSLAGECVQKLSLEEVTPHADRIMMFLLQVRLHDAHDAWCLFLLTRPLSVSSWRAAGVQHEGRGGARGRVFDGGIHGGQAGGQLRAVHAAPAAAAGAGAEELRGVPGVHGVRGRGGRRVSLVEAGHRAVLRRDHAVPPGAAAVAVHQPFRQGACVVACVGVGSPSHSDPSPLFCVVLCCVQPYVISSFADIAMAIEGDFDRYTSIVLAILKQAGEVRLIVCLAAPWVRCDECDECVRLTRVFLSCPVLSSGGCVQVNIKDDADEDLVEYINTLRVSILEAYTGIMQGLKEAKKQEMVLPAIDAIRDLLQVTI